MRIWQRIQRITPYGLVNGGLPIRFGAALHIEAGTLIVGAPGDAGSGARLASEPRFFLRLEVNAS